MSSILVLVHPQPDGSLSRHSLEVLALAKSLGGGDVVVGAVGGAPAIPFEGRVLVVEGEAFTQPRYSTDAAAAQAICEAVKPDVVLAPSTSRWTRCLAGVAQRVGGRIDTHVTALDESLQAMRWYYRQRIEAVLTRTQRPWFLIIESGSSKSVAPVAGTPAAVVKIAVSVSPRTEVSGMVSPQGGGQTIKPEAELLFVAGAGWTKKQKDGRVRAAEAAGLILGFIDRAGASLGSSKSLVDLSGEGVSVLPFLSHLNQVGQTGSTPRHPKGLATCCHGEEPHVVGWRFINERRAVNLDPSCGWARGKADVLYVADAFEVVAKLNELLSR